MYTTLELMFFSYTVMSSLDQRYVTCGSKYSTRYDIRSH